MSSQEVTVELSEDEKFVEEVVAQFENENILCSSGFSMYLNRAIKLIKNGGKIRDFCDLLDKSVTKHLDQVDSKLQGPTKRNTAIATNSADATLQITCTSKEKKHLRRSFKERAFASIHQNGNKVLDFLKNLVDGQYDKNDDYRLLLVTQPDMKKEISSFAEWVKDHPSSLKKSLIMDSVYLQVLSNTKIGLTSKKDNIVELIEGVLEVDEDVWIQEEAIDNHVKGYLKEKKSNFTTNQTEVFQTLVKFVKSEQDSLSVDNKSLEPAITITSEPEKRIRNLTKRLSDVVKHDNKKRNATKKRKRNQTLSDTVEEVVLVSDVEAEGNDDTEGARIENSSEVSENETDDATSRRKASKKPKDNRLKAKPIPAPDADSSEVRKGAATRRSASNKKNDEDKEVVPEVENSAGEDIDSEGARSKISEANTRSASDNGGVPESTEVSEVSEGASNKKNDEDKEVVPEVENSAGEEIDSEGARSKISEANTRSASDNGGVPESTEVSEVSKCASYKKNDEDKEVVPEEENSAGKESDSEGARSKISEANTRSADIGEIDEGNYIDYSCKYYSFNII
jgi:hypothetical protein